MPPSSLEYHISSTDFTFGSHGVSTGLVVLSTTTVFGLAAETASTSAVFCADRLSGAEIVAGEEPYGFGIVVDAP